MQEILETMQAKEAAYSVTIKSEQNQHSRRNCRILLPGLFKLLLDHDGSNTAFFLKIMV
jgi:hypothetical protein